jgi:hypothetical protein
MKTTIGSLVFLSLLNACVGEAPPDNHHIGDCADGNSDDTRRSPRTSARRSA